MSTIKAVRKSPAKAGQERGETDYAASTLRTFSGSFTGLVAMLQAQNHQRVDTAQAAFFRFRQKWRLHLYL